MTIRLAASGRLLQLAVLLLVVWGHHLRQQGQNCAGILPSVDLCQSFVINMSAEPCHPVGVANTEREQREPYIIQII